MISVETRDIGEAIAAVKEVYCAHQLTVDRRASSVDTRLRADTDHGLAQVSLKYGARVKVDAGNLNQITLVMHSTGGVASVRQRGEQITWSGGQTVVVSGNNATQFEFDPMFEQTSIRLDPTAIRAYCEQLAGVSLDGEVYFALEHFSPEMRTLWSQVLALSFQRRSLPSSSVDYLNKLVLDLLVNRCPHNYTHLLERDVRAVPRLAAEAAELIDSSAEHEIVTVAGIAAGLGVSARSIERAFRETYDMTPGEYIRNRRLDQVRRLLETAPRGSSVIDLAAAYGFFHAGRFARYYRERYGESPSTTLGRSVAVSDYG